MTGRGLLAPGPEPALPPLGTPDEHVTTAVDVRPWLERKWAALRAHASTGTPSGEDDLLDGLR